VNDVQIGFNMFLWGATCSTGQGPIFQQLKEIGYDGVEVPIVSGRLGDYQALGALLDDVGLERSAVTVLPHGCNPLSDHSDERRRGVAHIEWALDCTAALGARLLVGPIHQTLGEFTGMPPSDAEIERGCAFHRTAGDLAARRGIQLAIETMNRFEAHFLNTMSQLVAYLDLVDHPAVTGMYDTFHANIEELDPPATIGPSIRRIGHVHVSENDRGVPGRGHVPWTATFAALRRNGYDGWLTIEAFSRAAPDFAAKTRVWREFAQSAETIYRDGYEFVRSAWANASVQDAGAGNQVRSSDGANGKRRG
jgi:D-psicose/D-tagatose/L-ribulose 3-epimerase